jgi:hypothetical protein
MVFRSSLIFATLALLAASAAQLACGAGIDPTSGLYKSTDAGVTWARLEGHGLPAGIFAANDLPSLQTLMHDHGIPSMNEVNGR